MLEDAATPGIRIVGVTGGVGAGKSTVAQKLAEALSGVLLDADAIVAELLQDAQVLESIEVKLGPTIFDSNLALDREALSKLVFAAPEARQRLEAILHPKVRRHLWLALDALDQGEEDSWAVLDVPLLREGGLDKVCDFVVHVAVPEQDRCARACSRHGWSEEQWRAREEAQFPEQEKAARADAILDNRAGLAALLPQVRALLDRLHCLPQRPFRQRWPSWDCDPIT